MKNRLLYLMAAVIIILMLPITAKADEEKFKNNKCVVPFDLYISYEDDEKIVRSGFGILVGVQDDGAASNLIANANDVRVTEEELQAYYSEKNIDEDSRGSVNSGIKITVEKDMQIKASVNNISEAMNLAVLNLEKTIYNHNSVIFDVDDDNIKSAQELYILDNESNYHMGYAVNESPVNGIKYIQFDSPLDWEQSGQAVFNEKEEFVGMIQNSLDGTHKNALSSKEIAVILKTLGVKIDVADHTIKPVDKQALIAAADMADKLDLSLYTEETASVMKEQIQIARSIIISEEATQEEVDEAFTNLNSAQDALVIEKKMDTITLVFIIVSGVLVVGIIIFILVNILIKKNKKKKEKAKAEIDAKRAPVSKGPYVPSSSKNKNDSMAPGGKSEYLTKVKLSEDLSVKENSVRNGTSEKLTNLAGFAPSSKAITINEEDTTVLSAMDVDLVQEKKILAHLVLSGDQKRIDIDRNEFILGKSIQKADYVIDNKSVSRAHLSIVFKEGKFYATDLSSLNGSFINENKIKPQEETELKNEDRIKLADVEMTFYIE